MQATSDRRTACGAGLFPALPRLGLLVDPDHLRRRLHQLDEDALARERKFLVAPGMDEADVVAGRALADATRREADPGGGERLDRGRKVVHPEADVVERRLIDPGFSVRIERLHQVDLHAERRSEE